MKKIAKVLIGVLLFLFLIIAIASFLAVQQYHKAFQQFEQEQKELSDKKVSFYRFDLEDRSMDQPPLLPIPKRMEWTNSTFQWVEQWQVLYPRSLKDKPLVWVERLLNQPVIQAEKNANLILRIELELDT